MHYLTYLLRTAPRCFRIALLMLLMIASSGCVRHYSVALDGIGTPNLDKRYVILPGNPDIRPSDLYFQEYAQYLARVMQEAGFSVVAERKEANAAVLLSYGVSDPQAITTYSPPPSPRFGLGFGYPFRRYPSYGFGTSFATDYYGSAETRLYYTRVVVLDAVDIAGVKSGDDFKEAPSLWKLNLANTTENGNLRDVIPRLLEAGRAYMGYDTHGTIKVRIEEREQ